MASGAVCVACGDLCPVGHDEGSSTVKRPSRARSVLDWWVDRTRVLVDDRVVGDDLGMSVLAPLDDRDGSSVPNVIRAGFEREAQDRDRSFATSTWLHELEEAFRLGVVDKDTSAYPRLQAGVKRTTAFTPINDATAGFPTVLSVELRRR